MGKVKVAIVLPYFGPGGADNMVFQLAQGIDQEEFQTEVFCVYGEPQNNRAEQVLKEKGIPVHHIRKKKGFSVSAIVKLFRELDAYNPDVIHTHLYACVYAAPWPVIRRKPFLHTLHTLPKIENKRSLRRILTKFLVKHKRMIPVAISKTNQRLVGEFYGLPLDQVPMVQNPVDVQRFSGAKCEKDDVFRFITVGRFSKEKNQQMMYRALAAFLAKGHEARLLMLGKGEEEANLKALAKELGLEERIDYAGHVNNVEDYLKSADVFLLSSHYEAQPLCVLEAMAAGLPVISTDVGGVSDIVTDNGILVSDEDVEAMAQAMEQLYLNGSDREKMSRNSEANAATFDVSNTICGYSQLYRNFSKRK